MSTSEKLIYYSDSHDVDENETIIPHQGGRHVSESEAGALRRDMTKSPTNAISDYVASKK